MSGIRIDQTATLLRDGTVLVAGGSFGEGPYATLASAELYDPKSGEWTATGSMVEDRQGHTATLLDDGTVLVVGGTSELGQQGTQYRATAELFDPVTRAWRLTTPMNSARAGHTATLLADGTVLVAGGSRIDNSEWELLASAEIYNPRTATWTPVQPMAEGRQGHTATRLIGGTVLVAGGIKLNGASARSATVYDPGSRTWSNVGLMITGRNGHVATLLGDATVLVVGGQSDLGPEASAEVYQPTTRSWTRIDSMAAKRSDGTATLLQDGRVLVVGGYGTAGYGIGASTTPSAEIYDPRDSNWTSTASMPQGRRGHEAILLINGNVLVEGGNWSGDGLPSVTFLYDPDGGP
jgi:N-acetylneuraminic acid mutarotase